MKKQKKMILKGMASMGMALCLSAMTCITGYAKQIEGRSIEAVSSVIDTENEGIMPMAVDAKKTATLSISSSTATAVARVSGISKEITKINITMYLQKKTAKGDYQTIKTWNGSKNGNYYNFRKTYTISKGTYRVKAKIVCYKGSKSETAIRFSNVKTH